MRVAEGLRERLQRICWSMERDVCISITVTPEMFPSRNLELRILQLYVWDLMTKRFVDGCRTASLAQYGAYEVRLVEPLQDLRGDTAPFWIELYDHMSDTTIDSCGGDLEEVAGGAESLISQGKLLNQNSSWRRAPGS